MLHVENIPYGILYSFQPEYLAKLQTVDFNHNDDYEEHAVELADKKNPLLAYLHELLKKSTSR